MIPHESLGKEVYNVNSFGLHDAVDLLIVHPCVYYTCGHYERASEQANRLYRLARQYNIADVITIRRVGRRVVAERGPGFNSSEVELGFDALLEGRENDIPSTSSLSAGVAMSELRLAALPSPPTYNAVQESVEEEDDE
jgi:hypothetical protein